MNDLFNIPTTQDNKPPDVVTALYAVRPDWQLDGHGIVGPQKTFREEPVRPHRMDFQQDTPPKVFDGGGRESCTPPDTPDTTKVYIKATKYNSTSGKWECSWIETCSATCGAS